MANQRSTARSYTPVVSTKRMKKKGPAPRSRGPEDPKNPGKRLKAIWKKKDTELSLKAWARKQSLPAASLWLSRKVAQLDSIF